MRRLGTRGLRTLLLVLYPLLAVAMVPLVLAGVSTGLRGAQLFNDPSQELGVLWGVFSFFGILLWASATACCALGWAFLTRTSRSHPMRSWFAASMVLSGALTLDDTFSIHELVLPDYVGVPEIVAVAVYSVAIGWYLIRFRMELLSRQQSAVFVMSLLFLGISLALDVLDRSFPYKPSIEDTAKLLGITAWVYFFFQVTLDTVTQGKSGSQGEP